MTSNQLVVCAGVGQVRSAALLLCASMFCTPLPLFAQEAASPTPRAVAAGTVVPAAAPEAAAAGPDEPASQSAPDSASTGGMTGWVERHSQTLGSSAKDGFSPAVGTIVSGSGLSGGLGYRTVDVFVPGLGIELGGMLSVRRYQHYYFALGLLGSRPSTLALAPADSRAESLFNDSALKASGSALYLDARYRDYPRHTSYGLGIDSQRGNRSDYALRGTSVDGVWNWQFLPSFGVSVRAGVLDLTVASGRDDALVNIEERFVPAEMPGAISQPRFATAGIGLVYDTRSEPRLPVDGMFVGLAVRRSEATSGSALDFTRVSLDARTYWSPLNSGVVAIRGLVSADQGSTPFYLKQTLGGSETLRGFANYRFQDQALVHATVEYRWRVHRYVEVVPFIDSGTVAPALDRVAADRFKTSPGVGVRLSTAERALFRLDWAHGSEGHRVVAGFGPIF